jgi:hypothetical protein
MIVSINQSATEITFNHPNLNNTAIQLELTVTYNCGTPVVYDLQDKVAAITNGTFVLNLDDYYTTTDPSKFADGIYTFSLKFVYMTTSSNIRTIINKQCFLVDYDLKCSYINAKDFTNFDYITEQYKSLIISTGCEDCDCASHCTMYNDLLANLTLTTTTNAGCTGCN